MKVSRTEPGMILSGVAHMLLLAGFLVAFSTSKPFEDAQESVPVEVLSEEQFNQITKGEKEAPQQETPKPRVDRQAAVQSEAPRPPVSEAPQEVSPPPPELRRAPDPEPAEVTPPVPPQAAPTPPPRPEPESEPAPPVPVPPARPPQPPKAAETPPEPPVPVPTPRPAPPQTAKPAPKPEPKPVVKPDPQVAEKPAPVPPRRPNIPQTPAKPKPDQIAALAEKTKNTQPAPKPRAAPETSPQSSKYDPSAINKLLSREKPSQRAATGAAVNPQAARGAPNASAAKMSPSLWGQLDGLLQDQYKRCWNYAGLAQGQKYIPQISVSYSRDGALQGQPRLMNPPSDPAMRSLADSAMRAVQRCNPLRIPAQFAPFYDEWKGRVLRFDPEEMMG